MISQISPRYLMALIYGFVLVYVYGILSTWWGYFGFTYLLPNASVVYLACFVAAIPVLILPARATTIAQVTGWILYILVFLPCMLVPLMQQSSGPGHAATLFFAVFAGTIFFALITRPELKRICPPKVPPQVFWLVFALIWTVMMGITLYGFGGQIRFAGVEDIYDQRFASMEIGANPVIRYSLIFCANAFNPFLIAYGLHTRRWAVAGVGIASQILLYGTVAFRATLLSPLFIITIFTLFDRNGTFRVNRFFSLILALSASLLPLMQSYDPNNGLLGNILTLVYLRTLLISGVTFGVYDNFFSIFPVTHFSNSAIVGHFIQYPYGIYKIGEVVGLFLVPNQSGDLMEFNANFLATDGVASIGLIGIPVMAAALGVMLQIISKFVPKHRTRLAAASMVTFAINLSNVSMLTSLLTGGGAFLTIFAFLCDDGKALDADDLHRSAGTEIS
jgi:hypothetical protein